MPPSPGLTPPGYFLTPLRGWGGGPAASRASCVIPSAGEMSPSTTATNEGVSLLKGSLQIGRHVFFRLKVLCRIHNWVVLKLLS
jgi:hypothetical protein